MFTSRFIFQKHLISKRSFSFNYPCPRNLREIMKMSLILRETPENVEHIWTKYHSDRHNTISHVFESKKYHQFIQNLTYCPMFIYPFKKESGFFVLVSQAQK